MTDSRTGYKPGKQRLPNDNDNEWNGKQPYY